MARLSQTLFAATRKAASTSMRLAAMLETAADLSAPTRRAPCIHDPATGATLLTGLAANLR
jgi:hypothetical protein